MLYQFCIFKPTKSVVVWRTSEAANTPRELGGNPWGGNELVGDFEVVSAEWDETSPVTLASSVGAIAFVPPVLPVIPVIPVRGK